MDAKTQEMIDALILFKQSYNKITELWDMDVDLNELESVERYPFERSFDDICIPEWVNETVAELKSKEVK